MHSKGEFHYPPYAIHSKPISHYFGLFSVTYGMEEGLTCFKHRMELSAIISKYSTYKFVLLALKLITMICKKDKSPKFRDKSLILMLDHHLAQMIKNAEMLTDYNLAEIHAIQDYERNRLVDPLQDMDVIDDINSFTKSKK